jgi:hypothetical protein
MFFILANVGFPMPATFAFLAVCLGNAHWITIIFSINFEL